MSHTGFITLHRQLANWEWYTKPNHMFLFVHMLLKANHKKRNWQGIEIDRGSFITSINTLSIETKLTAQQIRTILKNLKKTGEINTQTNKQSTYVTICNYDTYQSSKKKLTNELTNDQQTPNKRLTTNNNDNNKNNENKTKIDEVMNYFREVTGSKHRNPCDLGARLKEGYTVEDAKQVIDTKFKEWDGTEQAKYIQPSTLFRKSNFDGYLNQAPEVDLIALAGQKLSHLELSDCMTQSGDFDLTKLKYKLKNKGVKI